MSKEISVQEVIEKFPSRFRPEKAGDMDKVFQFALKDDENFYVQIKEGQCTTAMGDHSDPSVTLKMNSKTFIKVITGQQDGMSAFLTGKLKAEGDVMLATQLGSLFSNKKA